MDIVETTARAGTFFRVVRAESELAGQVNALLAEAQRLDAAQDAAYGQDRRGDELTRREGRLAAIRAAKAALEAEATTRIAGHLR